MQFLEGVFLGDKRYALLPCNVALDDFNRHTFFLSGGIEYASRKEDMEERPVFTDNAADIVFAKHFRIHCRVLPFEEGRSPNSFNWT
jgi:hypothetical protein